MASFLSDFLNLSYDKCPNKIRVIRDIINRLSSGEMDKIINSIKTLSNKIDDLDKQVQDLDKRWNNVEKNWSIRFTMIYTDLCIEKITCKYIENIVDITITIKNVGTADIIKPFYLNVFIQDYCDSDIQVPVSEAFPLISYDTRIVHVYYPYIKEDEPVTRTLLAEVDSHHEIDEIDDNIFYSSSNNFKQITFTTSVLRNDWLYPSNSGLLIVYVNYQHRLEGGGSIYLTRRVTRWIQMLPEETSKTVKAWVNYIGPFLEAYTVKSTPKQSVTIPKGQFRVLFFDAPGPDYWWTASHLPEEDPINLLLIWWETPYMFFVSPPAEDLWGYFPSVWPPAGTAY